MTTEAPLRHADTDDALVRALNAAYEDGPSEAELRALEASVLAAIQGGGGAPPAPKSAPWTKAWISLTSAGAVIGLVALGTNAIRTHEPEPTVQASLVEVLPAPALPEVPTPPTVAVEAPPPEGNVPVRARRPRLEVPAPEAPVEPAPVEVVEAEDETLLLRRATASLRSHPEEALQITSRMARVAHPEWAEERERVAIEALVRLDRRAEAEARFTRFQLAYPSSAYGPRLRVVLSE